MTQEALSWWWTGWVFLVVGSFALLEGYAYINNTQMLTHYVRIATTQWPWTPYVMGAAALALGWHFWFE